MLRVFLCLLLSLSLAAQQPQVPDPSQAEVRFEAASNLVVVNVAVKDRDGKPIEGLKQEDFLLFEDGKRQTISVFDLERLSLEPAPAAVSAPAAGPALPAAPSPSPSPSPMARRFQDRRLIVLYFDFANMAPPEQVRSEAAALKFLEEQLTASDLVAVFTYSTQLRLLQDFTEDRAKLVQLIRGMQTRAGSDLAAEAEDTEALGGDAAEDAEFALFNTDKRLSALQQTARELGRFPEKKALVYISSGVDGMGIENQSQLRHTVNAAVRANVSFYPIDARGLVATAPAGSSSRRGADLFSGRAATGLRQRMLSQQDTLHLLAADTGGKTHLDSNDLSLGIQRAQQDINSYYILAYYSTNPAADGKFRKLRVEVRGQRSARLEYRPGYYAGKSFKDFNPQEKEQHLAEALALDDPVTELPIALEINYFRISPGSYFVPVALKIPGAGIALSQKGSRQETEFDFIGRVQTETGRVVETVRDTIKVKLTETEAGKLARRSLQYDCGFVLEPGQYAFKFLARENLEGKMGTFEARFVIPDLDSEKRKVRLSSVVWSGQKEKLAAAVGAASDNKKRLALNPLIQQDSKLVPSVTRVFDNTQSLLVYFEAYDAGENPSVVATLGLYRGDQRVFQSAPVRRIKALPNRSRAVPFELQAPLAKFPSGQYVAQVSVIDEEGRKFSAARTPLFIRGRD
jgi:VWFA-related protein